MQQLVLLSEGFFATLGNKTDENLQLETDQDTQIELQSFRDIFFVKTHGKCRICMSRASLMQGQVCLHSMHKYLPKIHIVPLSRSYHAMDLGNILYSIAKRSSLYNS